MKKILILGNSQLVVYKFRKEIVKELVKQGYEVFVSFPNGPFGDGEKKSIEFGCKFIETPINRRGKNPLQDIKLFIHYLKIIRKIKPEVVLAYTVKPDIYGGLACRILRVPFIANITGLGSGLINEGVIKKITMNLYKISLKKAKCIFFQNKGDKEFFRKYKIVDKNFKILPGSGVNIREFYPIRYPDSNIINFSFIGRIMKAKGIDQYLEAAKIIKSSYPNTKFNVFGYCEENYKDILEKAEHENIIEYHGLKDNIVEVLKETNCTVLPTYHPEGISNVLLEGAASARPLITTNRIGCKETVEDNVTGFLIKERDTNDLVDKIEKFLSLDFDQMQQMGLAGRKKIEKEFDRNIVVNAYVNEIQKIF